MNTHRTAAKFLVYHLECAEVTEAFKNMPISEISSTFDFKTILLFVDYSALFLYNYLSNKYNIYIIIIFIYVKNIVCTYICSTLNRALNEDTDTENEEDGASIYARSSNRDRQQSHGRSRSEDADVDDGTITISSDNDQEIEESDDGAARTAAAAADAERDDYELEGENDRPHNSWMTTEQKKVLLLSLFHI